VVGTEYECDVLMLDVRGVVWRGFKGWEYAMFLLGSEYGVRSWSTGFDVMGGMGYEYGVRGKA